LLNTSVQAFYGDLFDKINDTEAFVLSGDVYKLSRNLFNAERQYNSYWYDEAGHTRLVTEVNQ
jgi:hypothetical protein